MPHLTWNSLVPSFLRLGSPETEPETKIHVHVIMKCSQEKPVELWASGKWKKATQCVLHRKELWFSPVGELRRQCGLRVRVFLGRDKGAWQFTHTPVGSGLPLHWEEVNSQASLCRLIFPVSFTVKASRIIEPLRPHLPWDRPVLVPLWPHLSAVHSPPLLQPPWPPC